MKRLMLILILCSVSTIKLFSQTVLVPGDILFVGFKTSADDEVGNDCVKLVTLRSLECNTVFVITDNNSKFGTLIKLVKPIPLTYDKVAV